MVSITTWMRLEPHTKREVTNRHLAAPIHDPLWLLALQWRLGESSATDGGSAVVAKLSGRQAPLSRWAPGAPTRAKSRSPDSGPIEACVEKEDDRGIHFHVHAELLRRLIDAGESDVARTIAIRYAAPPTPSGLLPADDLWRATVQTPAEPIAGLVPADPARFAAVVSDFLAWFQAFVYPVRRAVELGQALERRLSATQLQKFRTSYPIRPLLPAAAASMDSASRRFHELMASRCIDGELIAARLARAPVLGRRNGLVATLASDATLEAPLIDWLTEVAKAAPPGGVPEAWNSERLEYAFATSAFMGPSELCFKAEEYDGERVDWYTFDRADTAASLRRPGDALVSEPVPVSSVTIPTPATFRGMPSSRFWELEDREVALGSAPFAPGDSARLALIEFALVAGNDWFVVPHPITAGSLNEITTLTVVDAFGVETAIKPYESAGWGMFRVKGPTGPSPGLLVPTSGVGVLEGPAIEEVRLLRDEMANLVFAVEANSPGPLGRPVDRSHERAVSERAPSPMPGARAYHVRTDVPNHWIPLLPVVESGKLRLRRGAVVDLLTGAPARSRGLLLEPWAPLAIFEEEVPRSGARVTRTFRAARGPEGQWMLWVGRSKTQGRGEGSSGLRFDLLK
jgi:hypothetical protein